MTNNIQEFENMLRRHDWYYDMADDGRSVRAGRESLQRILYVIRSNEGTEFGRECETLYNKYADDHKIF
jgi:hypothetical protein